MALNGRSSAYTGLPHIQMKVSLRKCSRVKLDAKPYMIIILCLVT